MRFVAKLAAAALLAGVATGANAVVVYSEDFNAAGFVGGTLLPNDTSDRFGPTNYFLINDFGGWSFNGNSTFLARAATGTDGALLLNEFNGLASRLITGLTIGQQYSLSFLLSGDNRPGRSYVLGGSIAALSFAVNGTVGTSGSNPGTQQSFLFTAVSTQHNLIFDESAVLDGSPIIDNIVISTVGGAVPEPSSWAMLLAGFGMVGFAARRRRVAAAA
jgi:hypothetical protein